MCSSIRRMADLLYSFFLNTTPWQNDTLLTYLCRRSMTMGLLVPCMLLALFCISINGGKIQWKVGRKVNGYGQDLVLFCEVEKCCSKQAGWSVDYNTIFVDVRLINVSEKAKYDASFNTTGFSLIIRNLTKDDLNKTYICAHGFEESKPKTLEEIDAFLYPVEESGKKDVYYWIFGVVVLIVFVIIVCCYVYKRRKVRRQKKGFVKLTSKNPVESHDAEQLGSCDNDETEQRLTDRKQDMAIEMSELRKTNLPKNSKWHGEQDLFQRFILDWKKLDQTFTVTRAAERVKNFLKTHNIAIVTGSSGSGKSSIIHHVALELQTQGYEIIPYVTKPNDLEKNYKIDKNQVFVIDDIIGKVTLNIEQEMEWRASTILIDTIFGTDPTEMEARCDLNSDKTIKATVRPTYQHKLLISCRSHIFLDTRCNIFANYSKYQLNLMEKDMRLLHKEKKNMLKNYVKHITEKTSNKCLELSKSFDFFPLLCKLSEGKSPDQMLAHFSKPIDNIKDDMIKMRNDKMKFSVLALCVLCDNQYDERWVNTDKAPEPLQHRLNKFFSCVCGIDPTNPFKKNEIADNMKDFVGTYLKKIGNCYSFIHDKIYDIAAVVCGTYLFEHFVDHASSHFIGDRYWLECLKSYTECSSKHHSEQKHEMTTDGYNIIVKEDQEDIYFSRLVSDLTSGDTYSFLNNKQLCQERYREKLITYLKEHKETVVSLVKEIERKEKAFSESTPLWQAVSHGYNEIAEFLLTEVESNVNRTNLYEKSLLHIACSNNNQAIVQLLINKQADIFMCDEDGLTPLHCACQEGNLEVVKLLLNKQADISQCDDCGRTTLHYACQSGNRDIVELLLNKQADISNCDDDGWSPLHFACEEENVDVVELLINKHADISKRDNNGRSPLYFACKTRNWGMVELLLTNQDISKFVDGKSPLHFACEEGNQNVVKLLLTKQADISNRDDDGRTPLHFACIGGHRKVIELLLKKQADISKCDNDGRIPLHFACEKGDLNVVKLLLNKQADINISDNNGWSPLHFACIGGHREVIKLLLNKHSDISKCDNDGRTPLHFACEQGDRNVVKLLLSNQADIDICDKNGWSALHFACKDLNLDVVELLLNKNIDISKCDNVGKSALHIACEEGKPNVIKLFFSTCFTRKKIISESESLAIVKLLLSKETDISKCDKDGVSPLHCACIKGYPAIVDELLGKKAEISKCDIYGRSPLHFACAPGNLQRETFCRTDRHSMEMPSTKTDKLAVDLVQLLLNKKADVSKCDNTGKLALHYACRGNNRDIVQLLLNNTQADISKCDNDGKSPLHFACKDGDLSIVELLLSKQADISKCDNDGKSPLHFACDGGDWSIVELLLNKHADISKCDKDGMSPLHYACQKRHRYIVELLLSKHDDISKCDKDGKSPLHYACQTDNWYVVQLLLNKQADIARCDKDGKSPLHYACQTGHKKVVQQLLKKQADISKCDTGGKSPLHFACESGNPSVVRLLLKNQVDISKLDKDGKSALQLAKENGNRVIVELLQHATATEYNNPSFVEPILT